MNSANLPVYFTIGVLALLLLFSMSSWWIWRKKVGVASAHVKYVSNRFNRTSVCLNRFEDYVASGVDPDDAAQRALEDYDCV
jgi:hypothetical protein